MPLNGGISLDVKSLTNANNDYLSGVTFSSNLRVGEERGLYGTAGASVGGVNQLAASVGNVWNLGKNLNLDISLNGQHSTSIKKIHDTVDKYNDTRVFTEADLGYKGKHVSVSGGLRAGIKTAEENNTVTKKPIFTGVVNAGVHFGKASIGLSYAGDAGDLTFGLSY